MSSLNAKPGYTQANAQYQALKAQVDALLNQRDAAAREFGIGSQQAQQYQAQASALAPQVIEANNRVQEIILAPTDPNLASPTVTTGESQSTKTTSARGSTTATTAGGVGAGTSKNSANSIGSDNNAKPTNSSARAAINASTASLNRLIPTEPNQLDQYASYTYSLSWYLMTTEQFNDMMARQRPTISGWKLLMQSGGAASAGRSQAFSLDYYMDDLEIITKTPGGGTQMAHSATDIKFKVVEPNGITLIESIFNAVQSMYRNSKQSQTNTSNNGAPAAQTADVGATFNYLQAHYCMVIQFYGYDKDGNLVSPIKGASNAGASASGYGQVANIIKYYPFKLTDIKFQIANRAIEYAITAKPIGQSYAFTTDRGTIPHQFNMTGQTVEQLLNGPYVVDSTGGSANPADPGARQDKPNPTVSVNDTSVNAGVNEFGNFTGETQNPNAVVAP